MTIMVCAGFILLEIDKKEKCETQTTTTKTAAKIHQTKRFTDSISSIHFVLLANAQCVAFEHFFCGFIACYQKNSNNKIYWTKK